MQYVGEEAVKTDEVIKFLVPEKCLTKGKNPGDHVLKAYRGASAETIRELDLTGKDAHVLQGLDVVFHAPLTDESPLPAAAIETKQRTWTCEGIKGVASSDGAILRTETRIHKEAPFGVVTYRYEKERKRNNASQGIKTMGWRFVESGKDATSAAPNAN